MSKHCDVCNKHFSDAYSYQGHLMGKRHLKSVEHANYKKLVDQNSIFLTPIPSGYTSNIMKQFFSRFGPIEFCRCGPNFMVVVYKTREATSYLLRKPIYFHNIKLNIRKGEFIPRQKFVVNKSNPESASIDNDELQEKMRFIDEIKLESLWRVQLEKFITYAQDCDALVEGRCHEVCNSLKLVLKKPFPLSEIIVFGSTATGLHLKQSDIDIYISTHEESDDDDQMSSSSRRQQSDGKKSWTTFKKIKSILFKNKALFSDVIPIPMAKIPVIKFHHTLTNMNCDVTFKNKLGVYNSLLIKHYLCLDTRLKPLIIIIKYWAKSVELCGTGKITNYSLVMIILFYLQQPNINLIPTVKELQSSCNPKYCEGWMINFIETTVHEPSNNESSIPELLHGFFEFYNKFNFAEYVICPYDGLAISRDDFVDYTAKFNINVSEFNLCRKVCIQDPLQRDHNIAEGWIDRVLQTFQYRIDEAVQLCEYAKRDGYTSLLHLICDPILKFKFKLHESKQFVVPAGRFEAFGLPQNIQTLTDIEYKNKLIEKNWLDVVYQLITKIFTSVYKYKLHMITDEMHSKQMKVEKNSDVHTRTPDKIMFVCIGQYCLNRYRKNKLPILDPTVSHIERETIISENILVDLKKRNEITDINFVCILEKKTNPLHVLVTLTNASYKCKSFLEITTHMRSKIPIFIDKELTHMVQYKKEL